MMKKLIKISILISLLIILCVPCYAKTIKHNLTETTITVAPKDKVNLRIAGVKAKNVVWKSKDKSIAKVNKSGVMTAVKNGTTKITAKCYGIIFTINVIVDKNIQDIDKVYNKLVYSDKNIDIYLYRNQGGKVYLKYVSKIEEAISISYSYIEINGEIYRSYYNEPTVYNNLIEITELIPCNLDYNIIDYAFSNEKITVHGSYYYNAADNSQPNFVMNFDIQL